MLAAQRGDRRTQHQGQHAYQFLPGHRVGDGGACIGIRSGKRPLLLRLDNANVVILMGVRRNGPAEVAVYHAATKTLALPTIYFTRALATVAFISMPISVEPTLASVDRP